VRGAFKRFHDTSGVERRADGGFGVTLDGKPLMTPDGAPLTLPTETLAALIAAEWDAAEATVRPDALRLTRLANLAQDRMPAERDATADSLARHAETDLLCHRAAHPAALVERQAAEWDPWLDWAREELGASLGKTSKLQPAVHAPEALEAVRARALDLDDFRLTGVAGAAGLLASAVLAFALERRRLGADAAHALATLESRFQQDQWGEDAEAAKRDAAVLADLRAAERFLAAL